MVDRDLQGSISDRFSAAHQNSIRVRLKQNNLPFGKSEKNPPTLVKTFCHAFLPEFSPPTAPPTPKDDFLPRSSHVFRRLGRDPLQSAGNIFRMKEDAENKARRRRRLRDAFPAPLNQIALRHVDAVQALEEPQRAILARVLAQVGVAYIAYCLAAIKSFGDAIRNETDLIGRLDVPERPQRADEHKKPSEAYVVEEIDLDYLAGLLTRCYPDMPEASADALVASDVMAQSLWVVTATRLALAEAKSDFVITVLYALFEEKLHEIEKTIAGNHSFIKAMQLSRPHWKPNQLT